MTMLVALTFDAEHPDQRRCHPGNAAAVLDLLAGEGVDATFFVQGRWAEAYPELLRQIVQGGHLVGNHSYYHARMPLLTKQGLRLDVTQAQKTLVALAGIETRPWFRSPFGASDRRVRRRLQRLGYRHIGWDVDGADWLPELDAGAVLGRITAKLTEREESGCSTSIVLLHTWPDSTRQVVRPLIEIARQREWQLVTLDALFHQGGRRYDDIRWLGISRASLRHRLALRRS